MHKLEKTLNRIAGKTRIFLNPGVKSTRLSFSENFFLNESVVKIFRRKATLWVELHESNLQRLTLNRTFPRLLKVLRFYPQGLSRILDHTKKTSGETAFYLDLSDAGVTYTRPIPADANLYAFARHQDQPGIGLIPDPYSLGDMSWYFHFTRYSSKEEARTAYEQRKNQIFWRGSSTGQLNSMDVHSNDRIKFCIDALEFPEQINAKITSAVQFKDNNLASNALYEAGVMAPHVKEAEFFKYMATMDLDGNSTAWGTLRKYLRLVHVIKPLSQLEMFYNVSQPTGTATSVQHAEALFKKLRLNDSMANNFETAWKGYQFAGQIRTKIAEGDATIFPLHES